MLKGAEANRLNMPDIFSGFSGCSINCPLQRGVRLRGVSASRSFTVYIYVGEFLCCQHAFQLS